MRKLLEGVTIETFPEALQKGQIKPGRRFAILLESDQVPERPTLANIAAKWALRPRPRA